MTKLEDVYMLPCATTFNFETISEIREQGYSRIPVYDTDRSNIQNVLLTKVRIICFLFSLNSIKFSLTRETDTKKLSNFARLQFLNDKNDQNTIFLKFTNSFFVQVIANFYSSKIEILQNCSAFGGVSFYRERKSKKIERK